MASEREKYRLLFEKLPDGYVHFQAVKDNRGKIADLVFLEVNAAFLNMSGLSRPSILGRKVTEVLPDMEEEELELLSSYADRVQAGELVNFQKYIEVLDRWYYISAYSDEPGSLAVIFRDITENKKVEEALHQERNQIISLFDSISEAVYVADPYTHELLYVNKFLKNMFSQDIVGGLCYEKLQGKDSPCEFCTNHIILENKGEPYQWEHYNPVLRRNYLITDRIVRWPDGRDVRFELAIDITELKQTEKALQESKENLQITLNSIGDAVMATDMEGNIVRMNPIAERLTGWNITEARGQPLTSVFKIVNSHTREPAVNPVKKVMETGEIVGLANHTMLIARDGTEYQIADSAAPISGADGEAVGVVLVFRDITEEYKLQEALKEREERLNLAMIAANDGMWDWNIASNEMYFDPRYYTMCGYEPDEFPHDFREWKKRVHPEDYKACQRALEVHLAEEAEKYDVEFRFQRKDGSWMWIRSRGKVVEHDETGAPLRMIGTHTDITTLKETEKELQKSRDLYANVLESIQDGISVLNQDLTIRHANQTIEEWHKKDLPLEGKKCFQVYQGRQEPCEPCPTLRALKSGQMERDEVRVKTDIGEKWIELFSYPLRESDSNEITGVIEFVRDITKRKQAERAIREREENLRITLNSIGDGVLSTDMEGIIVGMNPIAEKLTGWSVDEALGRPLTEVFNIVNSHTREPAVNPVERVMETGEIVGLANHTLLIARDGTEYQIADSAAPISGADGEVVGVVLVFRDITEEYELQKALIKSEERFNLALAAANDGMWDWNIASGEAYFDPRYYTISGYEPDDFPHNFAEWEKRVHPDDIETCKKKIGAHLAGQTEKFDVEFRFLRKDGTWMWIRGRGEIVERDEKGTPLRMVGTHSDITLRKEAEEEIKSHRERLAYIIEGANVGTWEWNVQTGQTYFNEKWAEIIGYTLEELLPVSIETWQKFTHPDDLKASDEMLAKHFAGEIDQYHIECRMKHKDGHWVWILDRGRVISWTEDGNPLWMFGTHMDITQAKEAQEALRESEKKFRLFAELAPVGIIIEDENHNVIYMNKKFTDLFGYTQEDISKADDWWPLAYPDESFREEVRDKWQQEIKKAMDRKAEIYPLEFPVTCKDGSVRHIEFRTKSVGYMNMVVFVDISERKEAEEAIRAAEETYRNIFIGSQVGLFRTELETGLLLDANDAVARFIGYDNRDELLAKPFNIAERYVNPEDREDMLKLLEQRGKFQDFKAWFRRNDGSERLMKFSARLRPEKKWIEGVVEDITEQYRAEKALREGKKRIEDLHESTLKMSLAQEEEEIYDLIIEAAEKIFKYNICTVDMVEEDYFVVKATSAGMPEDGSRNMLVTEGIAGKCFGLGETVVLNNMWENSDARPVHESFRAIISTPIGDLGVFQAVSLEEGFFSQEDVRLTEILTSHAAEAIKRIRSEKRIKFLGFRDSLTHLYNRAYLEEELKRLDTERQLPTSIIMADLNGLKLVNDTYGHHVGDEMLKMVAEVLRKSCRQEDIIARWGGDEFVILLPKTTIPEAEVVQGRIIKNCHEVYVEDVPVSLALGVACKETPEKEISEILREVEDNMYKQKLSESRSMRSTVLSTLLKTLAEKSFETEVHTRRMQKVAQKIGKKMGLSTSELSRLDLLITLHDIGKINIPEDILVKKGPLTDQEWTLIKKHPEIGFRITRTAEDFSHVAEDILAHHERWDGSGYPRGLVGSEVPLLARITAIADAYEVMSNGRPYKKALNREEIVEEFKRCAGKQFDPQLVEVFLSLLDELEADDDHGE